ncbi:radical SAM protein [Hyalangium sp.]|uniref:radical SAM protein n=1 Tax=Hyalangium sp. TaxID=2028555 RepID=UPI002D24CF73|nr:radical SAM protein [Hyalangium sp.]HYI00644.1 radical SAM protein [Hyalangium sp.]
MDRMKVFRFDESLDVNTATESELGARLERLWDKEPVLRPRPEMHDYQLTYPPAVQMEKREGYRRTPSDEEYLRDAVGSFSAAGYYFHFGFCKYRCRYCFHYELLTKHNDELMARYVGALSLEMRRVRELTPRLKPALYFLGGGTPTALPVHLLERFLQSLVFHFGPPRTSMSTVEAKPVTASDDKLRALVQAGFRRINLGVQTLDPELYAFHHQKEDVHVALDAIERARQAGFEFINIDIMTGLERQTPESWQKTLAEIERLATSGAVDSVFIYPYHDDPRSGTYGKPGAVPSFVQTAHSDAQARALFTRLGWKELGARFYRSPRHMRRELLELAKLRVNPAYGEVLYHGLGNSSFSIGDRATFLNHRDVLDYCAAVEKGGLGIAYWRTLDDSQRATRDVTFDLLYSPFTRVRSRAKKYGAETMAHHRQQLERWAELGLGEENRLLGTFSLTPLGKLVHQQLIPQHYLLEDRRALDEAMQQRQQAGRRYRGY